ncbi:MAG: mechanosensitive ion channel domain-containing protein [Pseudomonadota bacterium]
MLLSNLIDDLITDRRDPGMVWQIVVLVACILLGWVLSRLLRTFWLRRSGRTGVELIGSGSFLRVFSPLLMVAFLGLATLVLPRFLTQVNLLRVAVPLFVSLAVIRLMFYLLHRVFARQGVLGSAILTFERVLALLVWIGVCLYLTGLWSEVFAYLEATTLPLGKNKVSLATIMQAGVSVLFLLMVALWAGAALEERLMGVQGLHSSLRVVMARMSRAVLVVVAVLVSLSLVGIDLTVLSVFGGAFGVGLGLGMQKIASNYVSGIVILLERSLSIGDMISVDKYSGKVSHINARYTVMQGLDGVETVLPNEMLVSGAVQNQSLSSPMVRLSTVLTLSHECDLDVLFPLLEQLPVGVPRVLAEPPPSVALNKFAPEGFVIELGFSIDDPENGRGGVISDVNKKIYALLKAQQITLPFVRTNNTDFIDARIAAVLAGLPPSLPS